MVDGARDLATELKVPFLGHVPLVQSIRESGDVGRPAVLQEGTPAGAAFAELCDRVMQHLQLPMPV